jgi:hypothetical protein
MDAENFDTFAVVDPDEFLTAAAQRWLALAEHQPPGDWVAEMMSSLARKWLEA